MTGQGRGAGGDGGDGGDWVETVVRIAAALGLNPIRVRWKLEAYRRGVQDAERRRARTAEQVRYQHKICPHCGALQDGAQKRCARCGRKLGSRAWHVLNRLGIVAPEVVSVSGTLGALILLVWMRQLFLEPDGIMSFSSRLYLRFGANFAPLVFAENEWWRLGSHMFLHGGLLHIGFNLMALSQIGPAVEHLFGRARMAVFYVGTGVVGGLASAVFTGGLSVGASGAIMGLVGVAAGWGHRDGGPSGLEVRNRMLQWAVYVTIFGMLVRADHAAHLGGFAAGAVLGWAFAPRWRGGEEAGPGWLLAAALAWAALAAFVYYAAVPHPLPEWILRWLAA